MSLAHATVMPADRTRDAARSGRITLAIVLLFVASQVLSGVLRWALGSVGLAPLVYVPALLLWLEVARIALGRIAAGRLSMSALWLCLVLVLAILVGLLSLPAKQVLFGTWILAPVLFGHAAIGNMDLSGRGIRIAAFLAMAVAAFGVIGNAYLDYPWVGANFELGGKDIAGSREWHIGEQRRLAGFARSSFDCAGQIAVFAVIVNASMRSRLLRWLVWGLAIVAIDYTTSRGVLLALLAAMTVIEAPAALRRVAAAGALGIGLALIALPPLLAWTGDYSQVARLQMKAVYGSYLDRMSFMWPGALDLLAGSPMPLLGRGLGGIGAAQTLFEPDAFNAADNLFVYQFVTLGALALPIIAVFAIGALRHAFADGDAARTRSGLWLVVIWYGSVGNIVEHPILAMTYGLLLHAAFEAIKPRPAHPRGTTP